MRRAEIEIRRASLVATSHPLGPRVEVEGWSAREPVVTCRWARWGLPFARLAEWDVFVEGADGRRIHLVTLLDHASVTYVVRALADAFCDVEETVDRSPFALRFGPMPARVTCTGDPREAGRGTWRIELRAPRTGLAMTTMGVAVGTLVTLGSGAATWFAVATSGPSLLAAGCPACFVAVSAFWTLEMIRQALTRAHGRATLELEPGSLVVRASPPLWSFARRGITYEGLDAVVAKPERRTDHQGVIWGRGPKGHRNLLQGFPIEMPDADYVARVLDAYYAKERPPEEGGAPTEPLV